MPRDKRLLWSILLFVGAACSGLYQGLVTKRYIEAATYGDFRYFVKAFHLPIPPRTAWTFVGLNFLSRLAGFRAHFLSRVCC